MYNAYCIQQLPALQFTSFWETPAPVITSHPNILNTAQPLRDHEYDTNTPPGEVSKVELAQCPHSE